MEFLNLSFFEFGALFALGSGLLVAMYLLDRSRQKIQAATLRFWQMAQMPPKQQRRRRIQEPWSLLLQILALLLLLLAASQLRWSGVKATPRAHVLVMDVSAASGAKVRSAQATTVLAASQSKALAWLAALPPQDKVLLLEAGSLLTPRTAFETKRSTVERAVRSASLTTGATDLAKAFQFAEQLQRKRSDLPGEIVYAGPARIQAEAALDRVPQNLRLLVTESALRNVGIRKASVRRDAENLDSWSVLVTVKNYDAAEREVRLAVRFGGVPVSGANQRLRGGAEETLALNYRTRAKGELALELLGADDYAADDRVQIELPALAVKTVDLYTSEPALWRPLLGANPVIAARYSAAGEATATAGTGSGEGMAIFDSGAAGTAAPTRNGPTLSLRTGDREASELRWNEAHPIASGLRSRDYRLRGVARLEPRAGETVVLDSNVGPLVVAGPRSVRMGFQPLKSAMRQELAGPLLMANALRYLAPESYRQWESIAASPGTIRVAVESKDAGALQVLTGEGKALPFSLEDGMVQTFSPLPGTVRIVEQGREVVYSLTLPDLPDRSWEAPRTIATGVPPAEGGFESAKELWRWLAIGAALVLFFEWWKYGKGHRAWLKYAALAAIAAALFGPAMSLFETKLAVTVLADTSQSLSREDLDALRERIREVAGARGRHIVRVAPFARGLRSLAAEETGGQVNLTGGEAGRGTNLEAAIREAIASTPADLVPHLVLLSDGKETEGSAVQALWQAQQLNIPIDTYRLEGRAKPQLAVEGVRMPPRAFSGEKFPVAMQIRSPKDVTAEVELEAEGKRIGAGKVTLKAGLNDLDITSAVATSGVIQMAGKIRAEGLGEARFDQAISIEKPKLLYISGDPAGTEANLMRAMEAFQFEVTRQETLTAEAMGRHDLVVLNNQDLEGMPANLKNAVESYVKQGGGLLSIGGERNQYVEKKPGTPEDALERTLPAKLAPPRSPEGTCVVLVLDKSSSMEGRKMDLARSAAIGVLENLRPIDLVGVLIFDNSHQWAIPIRRAEDKVLMKRLAAGITADGGTQIAPALAEAYKKIVPVKATFKHIVLLTDGISEEGDSIGLSREAALQKITISTVGLGQDVNKGYLEKIAANSKGRSYFINDPSALEQILLRDVMEFTGSTAVEKPAKPIVLRAAEVLEGTDIAAAPPLKGYVKYEAKPAADLLLNVPGEKANEIDPLLVRWQYGLGRVTVFTSDAKSRWADEWVSWKGFDPFWGNVLRDLLPHAAPEQSSLIFDPANRELEVTYRLRTGKSVAVAQNIPAIFVVGPNGFQQPVKVQQVAAGVFRGRIEVGDQTGLFRVRPRELSENFPEVGYYRPEAELLQYGNNEALLRQLAEFSGGQFEPRVDDIFRGGGKNIETSLEIWPWLLGLAILLNLVELFLRKGASRLWGGQSEGAESLSLKNAQAA
ncbi:MAG: VWA domain-containing protein [Bryobacter sp.]|nr:VWA domain-containing protein [Bryobacter sp.]